MDRYTYAESVRPDGAPFSGSAMDDQLLPQKEIFRNDRVASTRPDQLSQAEQHSGDYGSTFSGSAVAVATASSNVSRASLK